MRIRQSQEYAVSKGGIMFEDTGTAMTSRARPPFKGLFAPGKEDERGYEQPSAG